MKLKKPKYKLMTVWSYKTNPGEEYSRVHIAYGYYLKSLGGSEVNENIYYVFIEHEKINNPYKGGLAVAITEAGLERSSLSIDEGKGVEGDFIDGYEEWREYSKDEFVLPYSEQLAEIINAHLK
ncbi:hypothetical protein MO867_13905 [Microbulbifer sp. OS29]|uniref:Uncharacterized protein n=1 Tax=Microbulbifer okhotskensis TaxID=2926617 RepID=A0A9X2J5Q0_9GAMM|nr:hypothetical protein [Microbulbifer okhotskensis]MCO1335428.1 hypothetical protein [Microbulbifer okhotskensis]